MALRVSSADLQRSLSRYREIAEQEPVIVTTYNKDQIVMISADLYNQLIDPAAQAIAEPYVFDRYARAHAEHYRARPAPSGYTGLRRRVFDFHEMMFTANALELTPEETKLEIGGYVLSLTRKGIADVSRSPFLSSYEDKMVLFSAGYRMENVFYPNRINPYPSEGPVTLEHVRRVRFVPALLGLEGTPEEVAEWMVANLAHQIGGASIEEMSEFRERLLRASLDILAQNRETFDQACRGRNREKIIAALRG